LNRKFSSNSPWNRHRRLAAHRLANSAQKFDFKSAAKYLERASQTMSRMRWSTGCGIFTCTNWCYDKELEPYFPATAEATLGGPATEPGPPRRSRAKTNLGLAVPATPDPMKTLLKEFAAGESNREMKKIDPACPLFQDTDAPSRATLMELRSWILQAAPHT